MNKLTRSNKYKKFRTKREQKIKLDTRSELTIINHLYSLLCPPTECTKTYIIVF